MIRHKEVERLYIRYYIKKVLPLGMISNSALVTSLWELHLRNITRVDTVCKEDRKKARFVWNYIKIRWVINWAKLIDITLPSNTPACFQTKHALFTYYYRFVYVMTHCVRYCAQSIFFLFHCNTLHSCACGNSLKIVLLGRKLSQMATWRATRVCMSGWEFSPRHANASLRLVLPWKFPTNPLLIIKKYEL
jgi:hypothetical protein